MKVFLTAGTYSKPFVRLVRGAQELADLGHEVHLQEPSTIETPSGVRRSLILPFDDWVACVTDADVVVCHAAPSTIHAVWSVGKHPLVLPRRVSRAEHVDDHQVWWAASLGEALFLVDQEEGMAEALERWRTWAADRHVPNERPEGMDARHRVWDHIRVLVACRHQGLYRPSGER